LRYPRSLDRYARRPGTLRPLVGFRPPCAACSVRLVRRRTRSASADPESRPPMWRLTQVTTPTPGGARGGVARWPAPLERSTQVVVRAGDRGRGGGTRAPAPCGAARRW